MPGVTVRVKNTAIGVSTDLNGKYTLSLAEGSENLTLVFSFVGMESQEIGYTGKNVINVTLKENAVEMDEVVITGMFARKTESFTGSAKTYKAENLKEIGNQNILQSLSALDPSFIIADNNLMGSDQYYRAVGYLFGYGESAVVHTGWIRIDFTSHFRFEYGSG